MVGRTGAIPRPCSLTENASRVFLAQFVGDARAGQPHELGERCVRLTARRVLIPACFVAFGSKIGSKPLAPRRNHIFMIPCQVKSPW